MLTAPLLFLFCLFYSAQAALCEVEVNGSIQASLGQHEGYGYFYQTLASSSQRVFTLKFTVKIDTTREDGKQRFLLLKESARSSPLRTVECLRANNDSCVITYNHTTENLSHIERLTYHTTTFVVETTRRDVCRLDFIIGVKVADTQPRASLKWNQKGDMYMLGVNISGFPLPYMNDDLRCDGGVLDSAIKTSDGFVISRTVLTEKRECTVTISNKLGQRIKKSLPIPAALYKQTINRNNDALENTYNDTDPSSQPSTIILSIVSGILLVIIIGGLFWYCHKHQNQQLVVNNNIAPLFEPRKPSSLSDISVECNRPKSMAEDDISISSGVDMQLETDGLESSVHVTSVTYTSPQQPSSLHKPESLNELRC